MAPQGARCPVGPHEQSRPMDTLNAFARHGMRSDLRARLILWAFAPTMIILGAVALFTFYTYWQVTESLVMERNHELTRLTARQIAVEMTTYADVLDRIAALRDIVRFDPAYQQTVLRWSAPSLRVFDGGVVVLNMQGIVTAADPRRLDATGQDWSDRPYFRLIAADPRSILMSDIVYDGPDGRPVVAVALPIRGERSAVVGVIAGLFLLDEDQPNAFYRSLHKYHVRPESRFYVVDSQARSLDPMRYERIGQEDRTAPQVAAVLAGESGALRTHTRKEGDIIASYAPVPDTTWGLIEWERWDVITAQSSAYGRLLLVLIVVGLVATPLFVAVAVRRITQPLAALTAAARRMAGGDLGQVIALPRDRELAQLAEAFNAMSAELQALYAGLEHKVAERTRELETLNTLANELSRSLDLEDTLVAALHGTMQAVNVTAGAAFRYDAERRAFRLMTQHGLSPEATRRLASLTADDPLFTDERDRGLPVHWHMETLPASEAAQALREEGWCDAVVVGLVAKGRALGLILLGSLTPRDLLDEERVLLTAIGQQVSVAVENARLYEQAEESAIAAERNRLARELHDSVTQTLFSASLIAGVLPMLWDSDPEEARRRGEELRQLTQGALAEMRTLLFELRPAALAEARLSDLLEQLALATAGRGRVTVEKRIQGEPRLAPEVRIAFYRVAQEALNNVVKHAQASQVVISLEMTPDGRGEMPERVTLHIHDDGAGFDTDAGRPGRLGLGIMRERAEAVGAALQVSSVPGQGATVTMSWPA